MKFRKFHFRLFPKLRRRKRKQPTLGYADYPRDISLDKETALYRTRFPGFHDNLSAEADNSSVKNCSVDDVNYNNSSTEECHSIYYSSFNAVPFSELRVNVNSCICACSGQLSERAHCVHSAETCVLTPVGTPSTVPRIRTRIKTNPWLPSPVSSPSLSPTDRIHACTSTVEREKLALRPSYLPLSLASKYSSIPTYCRINRDCKGGTNDKNNNPTEQISESQPLSEVTDGHRWGFSSQSEFLDAIEEVQSPQENGVDERSGSISGAYLLRSGLESQSCNNLIDGSVLVENFSKIFQYLPCSDKSCHEKLDNNIEKKDYNSRCPLGSRDYNRLYCSYDTDVSSDNSPVVEFLKHVKYEIDFSYEHTAETLLENPSFSRDDSFQSIVDLEKTCLYFDAADTDIAHSAEAVREKSAAHEYSTRENRKFGKNDSDESPSNMQESIDTGYASVSNESDEASFDSEYSENSEELFEEVNNNVAHDARSNASAREFPEQEYTESSFNTEIGERTLELNRMKDTDEDMDLEWDDDPVAQTLMLEFYVMNERPDGIQNTAELSYKSLESCGSLKRRNRSEMTATCVCRRRSRSLADIETSLDEKVTLLREEKSFVQRKIQEAIFEEKVRDHQLKIFRLLSGDKKKAAILDTLYDLRSRLEDQSERLQASYSTVLSLREMFSKRHAS